MKIEIPIDRTFSELKLPSPWIKHDDRDFAFKVQFILGVAIGQLDDAALALTMYENVGFRPSDSLKGDAESKNRYRLRFFYAEAFVSNIVSASRIIAKLSEFSQEQDKTKQLCVAFSKGLKTFSEIRHSLQHIEDRILGIGRNNKPLSANVIAVGGSFKDGQYGVTIADGSYAEIEINRDVFNSICKGIEDIIWSFEWEGPGYQQIVRQEK